MIGMGVGLQNPSYLKLVRLNESNHLIGRFSGRSARFWVVVQYRVDDDAGAAIPLIDHIGIGPSFWIKKVLN